mmetsp:Transcript_6401/g.11066  ORF Transcript_6401/g.11066 Transcript_6401/m.11066 type:complete len:233 (-) Transcript_6401:291-989(-)
MSSMVSFLGRYFTPRTLMLLSLLILSAFAAPEDLSASGFGIGYDEYSDRMSLMTSLTGADTSVWVTMYRPEGTFETSRAATWAWATSRTSTVPKEPPIRPEVSPLRIASMTLMEVASCRFDRGGPKTRVGHMVTRSLSRFASFIIAQVSFSAKVLLYGYGVFMEAVSFQSVSVYTWLSGRSPRIAAMLEVSTIRRTVGDFKASPITFLVPCTAGCTRSLSGSSTRTWKGEAA